MSDLNSLTAVEALTFTACQSQSKDKSLNYVGLNYSSEYCKTPQETLQVLVNRALGEIQEDSDLVRSSQKARIVLHSMNLIQKTVEANHHHTNRLAMLIHNIWAYFCRTHGNTCSLNTVHFLAERQSELAIQYQLLPDQEYPVSHMEAYIRFCAEFKELFGVVPPPMKGGEIGHIYLISERIWISANVQEKATAREKFETYCDLMEEDAIGSHKVYEEINPDCMLHHRIKEKVGPAVKNRVSSHYGFPGHEEQHHIDGNMHRENLFHHGIIGYNDATQKVALHSEHGMKKAVYWKKLTEEERRGCRQMHVTWDQREASPDGPDFWTMLVHRCYHFVIYFVLKNIVGSERPQVAGYTSKKKGRGVPDFNPIVIRHFHGALPPGPIDSKTSKIWKVRQEYATA